MNTYRHILLTVLALLTLCHALPAAVPSYTDFSELNKTADQEKAYRSRTFRAYLPVELVSQRNKVSPYSRYENPTGIYFTQGETVGITIKGKPRVPVKMIFNCFVQKTSGTVELKEGKNEFQAPCNGLGYISYYDPDPKTAPPLKLTIRGGKVNGIFTRQDSNKTWKHMLENAPAQAIDLMGTRCHFIFDVAGLRSANPDHGAELLKIYDDIIRWQQEMMGWDKYKKHPGNHVLGRSAHNSYMCKDGLGASFNVNCTPIIGDPERLAKSAWGVAHEFGHVHQMQPAICWVGTTEVTNNIFSVWANYKLNPGDMRLEHMETPNWKGQNMRGGRFDCFVNNAIVRRQVWQLQGGPDDHGKVPTEGGDVGITLAPLWQLQLYIAVACGKKDFYADLHHKSSLIDTAGMTHGMHRINFIKNACDAAKLDLSEFFVKTGMLATMNRYMNDYGCNMLTITKDMVEDALAHAVKYPKPNTSVIYYITANNVEIYRDKLAVVPTPGMSPKCNQGYFVMPADRWKNAVAFEAYIGDELARISLRGQGEKDNQSTRVYCPIGTTCVKAVQWDGKRYEVCRFKGPEEEIADAKKLPAAQQDKALRDLAYRHIAEGNADGLALLLESGISPDSRTNGVPLLALAAESGEPDLVEMLVEAGASPNVKGTNNRSPLHDAAGNGWNDIISLLLEKGADPMAQTGNGGYPIHDAIWNNRAETVCLLLPLYKDLNYTTQNNGPNGYPVVMAISHKHAKILQYFLEAGLKIDDPSYKDDPLLHIAARVGDAECIQLLLKAGADKNARDKNGKRAADVAQPAVQHLLK